MTQRLLLHLHGSRLSAVPRSKILNFYAEASSKRRRITAYHQGFPARDLAPTISMDPKFSSHDQNRSERPPNEPSSRSSAHSLSEDLMGQLPSCLAGDVVEVPIHRTRTLENNTTTTKGDYWSSDDQSKSWHAGQSWNATIGDWSREKQRPRQ